MYFLLYFWSSFRCTINLHITSLAFSIFICSRTPPPRFQTPEAVFLHSLTFLIQVSLRDRLSYMNVLADHPTMCFSYSRPFSSVLCDPRCAIICIHFLPQPQSNFRSCGSERGCCRHLRCPHPPHFPALWLTPSCCRCWSMLLILLPCCHRLACCRVRFRLFTLAFNRTRRVIRLSHALCSALTS